MANTFHLSRTWPIVGSQPMILVFGKTGQVGTELQRLDGVVTLGRNQADLSNPMTCANAIFEHAPLLLPTANCSPPTFCEFP